MQISQREVDAISVVTNPAQFANDPLLRLTAWATLKGTRGQTVVQHRLQSNMKPQTSKEARQ